MKLIIDGLSKQFQEVTAVKNITYTMENGVYGLLGANGAGKTTFMRILCTLLRPTSGNITCDGMDIFEMGADYRTLIGYLPQDFGYYPDFSVKDYLLYVASIKGVNSPAAKKKVHEMLYKLGLTKVENKKMKKLSGGMKRRVGIAQAIINNPQILILDEPTAGLDPNERIRFRNLLSELAQERVVLLSTHIVSDVEYIASEILLMKDGEIVRSGTADEIMECIPERVWSLSVPRRETDSYIKKYKVVNIKTEESHVKLRILSADSPHKEAAEEKLTLEDVYLHFFGEKAGGEDDAF